MSVELRHLRYFVTVAEELHFSRAAAQLHVAQPALSSQVRRLELLLGVSLLNRSTRNVELTEAGRLFLVKARKALAATEEAIAVATSFGRGEMGKLSLGVTPRAPRDRTDGAPALSPGPPWRVGLKARGRNEPARRGHRARTAGRVHRLLPGAPS